VIAVALGPERRKSDEESRLFKKWFGGFDALAGELLKVFREAKGRWPGVGSWGAFGLVCISSRYLFPD
jgi:hypothetical protein